MKRTPLIFTAVAAASLVLLFLIIRDVTYHPNVRLKLSPTTATVLIDDKKVRVKDSGIVATKGSHKLTVKQSGFSTYVSQIEVGNSVLEVTVVIDPQTEEGYSFMRSHPDEQRLRESLIGATATKTGVTLQQKNPIIKLLPYIDQYFRIDYGQSLKNPTDSTAIAIYITPLSPDGKDRALALLRQKGFDPGTLEIIYRDASPQEE